MRRLTLLLCLAFLFGGAWNCTNDPKVQEPSKEAAKEALGDGGTDMPAGKSCISVRECGATEDCKDGRCTITLPCVDHIDCELTQRCHEGRCATRCEADTSCPKGYVCTDGMCHQPVWTTAPIPNEGATQRTPIKVGLGVHDLDFPLTISMAGYGFRPGPKTPYSCSLGGSTGIYDRFRAKVLAFDDGMQRLFIIRSPLVFSTDYLKTQIAEYVARKGKIDIHRHMIMVSTHTHSGPARFWNLLTHLNFGAFGGGDFHPEILSRLAASFGEAVLKANADLAPAKVGYKIDRNFDPQDRIFSDRRGESPREKHPYLLVMRIDRMDDTPLAIVTSFAMHGVISGNTYMTQDAGGGLEIQLQEYLEAKTKKPIEAFYLQGSAGDVSPRGDQMDHDATQRMQFLGYQASLLIEKIYATIQTSTEYPLAIVHKRLPISREAIGYKSGEFYTASGAEKQDYRFGAFRCVEKGFDHGTQPDKKHEDGKLGCLFSVETLHGAPVPQFSKTHLTAAKIGNLIFSTFPGESTSWLAKRLTEGVEQKSGGKLKDIMTLGYAQDHQLYLLHEDDWWRGGYEASMSVWGPKFGEYLLREAIDLAVLLASDAPKSPETGIMAQDFYKMDFSVMIPRKTTLGAGTVVTQPPKSYRRLDPPFVFAFKGGWPGVDNPRVVLQKKEGSDFKDVLLPAGRPYDDSGHRMIMDIYAKSDEYQYRFRFEELEDFALGTYRFRFGGSNWDGSKIVAYEGTSEPFEIVVTDRIKVWGATIKDHQFKGYVAYPPGTNDDGKTAFESLESLSHRLRSPLVPWDTGQPFAEDAKVTLKVVVSDKDGKEIEVMEGTNLGLRQEIDITVVTKRQSDGSVQTRTRKALASGFSLGMTAHLVKGMYQYTITLTDAHGNTHTSGPTPYEVQ